VVWQRQAIRHGGTFLRHVIPAVVKPARTLWNEVIGFFFACLALMFGVRGIAYYRSYLHTSQAESFTDLVRVILTTVTALIMAAFAISSFRKARRIARS
jgi:hypothetical protein